MQHLIKICYVVQELYAFSLANNGRTDSHGDAISMKGAITNVYMETMSTKYNILNNS